MKNENQITDHLPIEIWYEQVIKSHKGHDSLTPSKIEAKQAVGIMKQRSLSEPTPVQAIFQEEQSKFIKSKDGNLDLNEVASNFPQFSQIQSTLYKNRLNCFPKLPTKIEDIKIEGEWSKTVNKEDFLVSQVKNKKDSAIIFCSKIGLEILSKAKRWHSDGTFETSPEFFYQFYIIHGYYQGKMLTISILLDNKKESLNYNFIAYFIIIPCY